MGPKLFWHLVPIAFEAPHVPLGCWAASSKGCALCFRAETSGEVG